MRALLRRHAAARLVSVVVGIPRWCVLRPGLVAAIVAILPLVILRLIAQLARLEPWRSGFIRIVMRVGAMIMTGVVTRIVF
jgi:hypothetical protein